MAMNKQTEARWNGASKLERGQMMRGAVGMAGKVAGRQTKPAEQGNCRRTQPADSPLGTGLEETTATDDRPGSKQTAADDVGLSPCR